LEIVRGRCGSEVYLIEEATLHGRIHDQVLFSGNGLFFEKRKIRTVVGCAQQKLDGKKKEGWEENKNNEEK